MLNKRERQGTIIAVITAVMWGIFLAILNSSVKAIPPLFFAGITTLIAAACSLIYCIWEKKLSELKQKNIFLPLLMITFSIVIFPYTLLFIGAGKTSGMNTAMLTLSEIIFTLIFTHFIGEKTTILKVLGAGGIFVGALFILYNGTLSLNMGDVLILFSTITYPIGNFYAKIALKNLSPSTILFIRSLFGGLFILFLAIILEKNINVPQIFSSHWLLILLTGVVFIGFNKILNYEAIKRLDISKAITLFMSFPLFSLFYLILFMSEPVSIFQLIGIIIMMLGVYFSVKRQSVDKSLTKYA